MAASGQAVTVSGSNTGPHAAFGYLDPLHQVSLPEERKKGQRMGVTEPG
jgi:hypothetical protein